mgnify:CR=1 FL=1
MPELNFKITGDDSELKKTLANIAKVAKENGDKIAKEVLKSTDLEVKSREKTLKATQDQKKASDEIVKGAQAEAKAQDAVTEAVKRKGSAFDAASKQIRPVQMSSSLDEVNASNRGRVGTIPSGTVVGAAEEFNRAANEARAFGNAAASANKAATETTVTTTDAIKEAIKTQNSLNLQLAAYRQTKSGAMDPAVVGEYNRRIKETQVEIAKLENIGKRGYDQLGNRIRATIGQKEILINRLRYFQDQLNYAKAPQSFVALNQKIQETENQLNRLANAGKKGFDELGNKIKETDAKANKFLNTIKGIGAALLAAFSVQMIVSWLTEAKQLAAKGEGIREAFAKLDNGKTLEMLRKATRGATSDIDLMSAALRAKNFQIAPELLAKGLELAGKVSRQTGQDITYLTDSFVNGLGRKSMLVLDNLQISQVQLRAEIKKTGDFQVAVANVVDAKLKAIGDVSDTSADRMARWATKIANMKEKIGQGINIVFNYDGLREATNEFYEQGLSAQKLQKQITPLLSKYDELTAKAQKNGGITKLSKVEQSLLKDVIKQVGDEIPGAITQFDKYGNAMALSTTRAKEFIKQQILVMQALNEDRIEKTTERIGDLTKKITPLKMQMDELAKTGKIMLPEVSIGGGGLGGSFGSSQNEMRRATEKEKKEIITKYQAISKTIAQQEALLASDSGQLLKKRQEQNDAFSKITTTDEVAEEKAEKARLKAEENLRKAAERQEAADAAALSAQENLQQRIQVLKDKFERDGLTKEQEARRAIVDEFKKLAFDIEQQGKKYDAYAKKYGAARALAVLGPKETTAQIEPIRKAAIQDLEYRQGVEKTKIDLDKQKALYVEYEDYKTKLGQSAADARFGKELNTFISYLDILKSKQKEIIDIVPEKRTGAQQEYLTWLESQIKVEVQSEQKKYDALVKEFIIYSDKRKALTEKYEADMADLTGKPGAQAERTTRYQDDINSLDDANVQKLHAYKALFKGIDQLSDANAKKVIANAQKMLNELVGQGKISKELADQIGKLINDTTVSLKDRMPDRLINLANQIDLVAEAVGGVDSEFGKLLHTLGNVVGQVGNIKKGMADFQTAQGSGDMLGQLSAGLGIFGAAFSIFKGVSSLFGDLKAGAEQQAYAAELQNKRTASLNKALERQVELINEAYGADKLDRFNAAILQSAANEKKYQDQLKDRFLLTGNKQTDAMIAAINEGGSLPGMSRDFVIKAIEFGGGVRLPKELEALQRLLDEGKLDAQTEIIVANLIEAAKVSKELANNLAADNIGSSLDSITDDFISNLTDGTRDFEKTFEDSIRNSILKGFKGKLIEQQLQAFYTQFAQATSDGNLSESEIATLKAAYMAASEKAKADFEALGKATGIDLTDLGDKASPNSLQGAYSTASQESINLLAGRTAAMAQAILDGNNIATKTGSTAIEQLNVSMQHLNVAIKTEQNTANTVVELKNAVTELKGINNKMSSPGNAAQAAGYN